MYKMLFNASVSDESVADIQKIIPVPAHDMQQKLRSMINHILSLVKLELGPSVEVHKMEGFDFGGIEAPAKKHFGEFEDITSFPLKLLRRVMVIKSQFIKKIGDQYIKSNSTKFSSYCHTEEFLNKLNMAVSVSAGISYYDDNEKGEKIPAAHRCYVFFCFGKIEANNHKHKTERCHVYLCEEVHEICAPLREGSRILKITEADAQVHIRTLNWSGGSYDVHVRLHPA